MTRIDMIFGSTSDEGKVMPGIIDFSKANPDTEIYVHWASADNTPEKVKEIMDKITKGPRKAMPLISGAGMSNVLTGIVRTYARIDDLVIGVPISDKEMQGLSSILSTGEKPPRNPVLTVPLDGSYTAANIAYKFLNGKFNGVFVPVLPEMPESPGGNDIKPEREKILKLLSQYVIAADTIPISKLEGDELVISPFYRMNIYAADRHIREIDARLSKGTGIQIGVANPGHKTRDYASYAEYFNPELRSTGYVTAGQYINAVIVAAQIMGHKNALAMIEGEKKEKAQKLAEEPMHAVKGGAVTKIPYTRIG